MKIAFRPQRALVLTILACAFAMSSCAQAQPSWLKTRPTSECGKEGPITMQPGVDLQRLQLLDENRRMAVYTAVTEIDAAAADKRRLPQAMASLVDLTHDQLLRMFSDAIKGGKRFAVFDYKATLTNEYSNALVDLKVTSAKQDFLQIEPGRRVVKSTVVVSLNLTDMLTGEDLLGDAYVVEGLTGVVSGARLVLTSADDQQSQDVRTRLGNDYVDALKSAFYRIRLELESKLRPLAKVLSIDGCDVGLAGGQKHGFQDGDELVVFRPQTTELGGKKVLAATKPIALLKCAGVGTESSQCTVTQLVAGLKPSKEDYAVITTASLQRPRER